MDDPSNVLDMSAAELDLVIGESLLAGQFGSKPASDTEKQALARRWFEINQDRFRNAVCPNPIVSGYLLGKENKTRNELLAAVVDALLKLGGWGTIPVAVLSARLLNYGLDRLCPENKGESQT
jgi:hypothetical protein